MRNALQSRRERRRIVREILHLFLLSGYNDDTDVSLDMAVTNNILIFRVGGGDDEARSVLGSIIKVVLEEHGVETEMADSDGAG